MQRPARPRRSSRLGTNPAAADRPRQPGHRAARRWMITGGSRTRRRKLPGCPPVVARCGRVRHRPAAGDASASGRRLCRVEHHLTLTRWPRARPGYPLLAFEEKPTQTRSRELINMPGGAWNAGMSPGAAGDPGRAREVHPADDADRQAVGRTRPRRGLRADHPDLDRLRGHGGGRRRPSRRHGLDGRRLERPRQLDRAPRRPRAGRHADGATGRVVQSGETIEVGAGRPRRPAGRWRGRSRPDARAAGRYDRGRRLWAHLAGARHLEPSLGGLLDRVDHEEVRG